VNPAPAFLRGGDERFDLLDVVTLAPLARAVPPADLDFLDDLFGCVRASGAVARGT
jgi:hypothetical protein